MPQAVHALIFDIGGVLAYDVWEHLLLDGESGVVSRYGLRQDVVRQIGKELWAEFAYQKPNDPNRWQDQEAEYWQTFVQRLRLLQPADAFINLTDQFIRPIPGMTELLDRLSARGIPMALCSNNTEFWFRRQWESSS